uniref:Beta-lactamase-related domain-containing protein n=1 Tax=Vitrella brassicaformis TaxID=1169539 RepID=A0A7S1JNW7_9ALVE|mmetsp:Transcript_17340/g.41675  ORF Transcript_17340/g.41675 Transcript_17340/m.41675 type:complete len:528 (+) Transcript_17340:208-1791(+)
MEALLSRLTMVLLALLFLTHGAVRQQQSPQEPCKEGDSSCLLMRGLQVYDPYLTDTDSFEFDPNTPAYERFERILGRATDRNLGWGAGLMRIAKGDGTLVWEGAYDGGPPGRNANPPPVTRKHPYEIASISKMLTAATVFTYVDEGKINLSDKIMDLVPNETRVPPNLHQINGTNYTDQITVEMLLNHKSGLPDYWNSPDFNKTFLADINRRWEPEEVIPFVAKMEAHYVPHTGEDEPYFAKYDQYAVYYSDTNYVLLGFLLEELEGKPLADVYKVRLYEPLNMTSTWLRYREKPRSSLPILNRYWSKPAIHGNEQIDMSTHKRQTAEWGGGGLVSTTEDLVKVLRGIFESPGPGGLYKNNETVQRFFGPDAFHMHVDYDVKEGQWDNVYSSGIFAVKFDDEDMGEILGHEGFGSSFAYWWPPVKTSDGRQVGGYHLVGTLNQLEQLPDVKNDFWWFYVVYEIVEQLVDPAVQEKLAVEMKELPKYLEERQKVAQRPAKRGAAAGVRPSFALLLGVVHLALGLFLLS